MYTVLCALCDGSVQLNHGNWIGYVGFGIVAALLIYSEVTKAKRKKNK